MTCNVNEKGNKMEGFVEVFNNDDNCIIYVDGHLYKVSLNKLTEKQISDLTKCIESIFNLGVMYGEDKVSNSIKEILKI